MKSKSLLFVVFLFHAGAFAQPSIQWQKCLGGSASDFAYYTHQTSDGGYIVGGQSASPDGDVTGNHGGLDCWFVKMDGSGNIQWQQSYGGSSNEYLGAITPTSDGGFIAVGWSNSTDGDVTGNHGGYDYWVVKVDANGALLWQKSLGGSNNDYGYTIQATTDGGYILTGNSNSTDGNVSGNHGGVDYWVVKISSVGAIQWQESLGGLADDFSTDIAQTNDGGYIVAGESASNDIYVTGNHGGALHGDLLVMKLNSAGTVVWQKCLGGSGDEWVASVRQTTEGGYLVAGESRSNDGDVSGHHGSTTSSDYWVVKLNETGVIQWQKSYGGSSDEWPYSIDLTTDGGYVIAGVGKSLDGDATGNNGYEDYWVIKINSVGTLEWQKSLGGTMSERAHCIQQTTDAGYIIVGNAYSNDGNVTGNHGYSDYWVVKLSPFTGVPNIDNKNVFSIYPNPLTSASSIQLITSVKDGEVSIYNMLGKEMVRKKLTGDRMEIERGSLESGIYFVRVKGEEREWVKKMVIE